MNRTSHRLKRHGGAISGRVCINLAKCVLRAGRLGVLPMRNALLHYTPSTPPREGRGCPGGGRPLRWRRHRGLFFIGQWRVPISQRASAGLGPTGTPRPSQRQRRGSPPQHNPGGARSQYRVGADSARGGGAVLPLASVLGRPPRPCGRSPRRGGLPQKLRPRAGTASPGSGRGLTAPSKAPAGDGRTFPARLNRSTQGNQTVQRSEPTVTAAGRDGNHNERALSPPLSRHWHAPWRRPWAIYAAAARRQGHARRGR